MADLPWDSSRCMRLLRPLKAHLSVLERQQRRSLNIGPAAKPSRPLPKPSVNDRSPDWLSRKVGKGKRRKLYTMTNRAAASGPGPGETHNITQPFDGEIKLPDTFLLEPQGTYGNAEQQLEPEITDATRQPKPVKKQRCIRAFHGVRADDNVGGVITSYLAIEAATQPDSKTSRRTDGLNHNGRPLGAASLRQMAVRAVAAHVEQEATDQLMLNAEDRYNVSEQLYADLDDVPLPRECGLLLQAQLIRAHATRIVCNALRIQVLGPSVALQIVDAMKDNSISEQDMIIGAAMRGLRQDTAFRNCLKDPMVPYLNRLLEKTIQPNVHTQSQSRSYPTGAMLHLLSNPTIPVEWLATPAFRDQWQPLVTSIACGSPEYYSSKNLMAKVLRTVCGTEATPQRRRNTLHHVSVIQHGAHGFPRSDCQSCHHKHSRESRLIEKAFTKSISSFLTILTALVVVGSDHYARAGSMSGAGELTSIQRVNLMQIQSFMHVIASQILLVNRDHWDNPSDNAFSTGSRCAAVLMCSLIIQTFSPPVTGAATHDSQVLIEEILYLEDSFCDSGDDDSHLLEDLPDLLQNICTAAAQISGSSVTTWFNLIAASLDSLESIPKRSKGFLQQFCRETAEYMEIFEPYKFSGENDEMISNFSCTPAKARSKIVSNSRELDGYRWEPMLSEWVSATPMRPLQAVGRSMDNRRPSVVVPGRSSLETSASTLNRYGLGQHDVVAPETYVRVTRASGSSRLRDGRVGIAILDDSASETDPNEADLSSPQSTIPNAQPDEEVEDSTAPPRVNRSILGVFVPVKRPQSHTRRISDFIPWSSPVSIAAAFPSSSPAFPETGTTQGTGHLSPPLSPLQQNSNHPRARTRRQTFATAVWSTREDERKAADEADEKENRPKRRCVRVAHASAMARDRRRRSGRLQTRSALMYDSEVDELA